MKTHGDYGIYDTQVQTRRDINKVVTRDVLATSDYKESDGRDTPNYRELLRKGKLLPLTFWSQYESVGQAAWTSGFYQSQSSNTGSDIVGPWDMDWRISQTALKAVASQYDFDVFVQAAAARIYTNSSYDVLTFVAELKKTILMFRGALRRLLDLLKDPSFKRFGNAWLEGRYGWRILLYDIIEISELMQNLGDKRSRFTERVGRTFTTSEETLLANYSGTAYNLELYAQDTYEVGVRGTVAADYQAPQVRANVITTAWELIPFSFVVDWFFTVGATLSAASLEFFASDLTAAGGFHVVATRRWDGDVTPNDGWDASWPQSGQTVSKLTLRVPTSVSFLPRLNVSLDDFKILDLMSLLRQRI